MGVRVQDLGFRMYGFGLQVESLGFRIQSFGFRVRDLRLRVYLKDLVDIDDALAAPDGEVLLLLDLPWIAVWGSGILVCLALVLCQGLGTGGPGGGDEGFGFWDAGLG